MKVLYIGNYLKGPQRLPTGITFLGDALEREGLEVIRASRLEPKILRLFHMIYTLWHHRKQAAYVLIDTYSTRNFWYAYCISICCRLLSLKYLPILHGGNLPLRLAGSPHTSRQLFAGAWKNVATSRYLLQAFEKYGFRNTQYIPNPLPCVERPTGTHRKMQPKLIWVRAFQSIYDPFTAIRVLEMLVKEYPEAELCMVGPDRDGSFELCKNYVRKHQLPVRFTGCLKQAEWLQLAASYDIFLHTSLIDNAPQSVLEAMSLGLCVVATRTGDLPNLLQNGKSGILVTPANVEEMLKAVHLLLQDQCLAQNLAVAARKVTANFEWSTLRNQWFHLLGVGP